MGKRRVTESVRKREKREGGRSVTESEAEYSGEIEEEVGSEGMEEERERG